MNRRSFSLVRDVERALAMVAAVGFTFALILGSVAPASDAVASRVRTSHECERGEFGANPSEPAAAAARPDELKSVAAGVTDH